MKTIFALFLSIILISCAKPPIREIKSYPEHSTEVIDYQIRSIYNEFMELSSLNNIKFKNKVSIGFTDINDGDTIGLCTYRMSFREIDLDRQFWNRSSWLTKTSLVYHEMAHCYCDRNHDFGDGTLYPDDSLKYLLQTMFKKSTFNLYKPEGFLEDGCPASLMYPKIISDDCFRIHYNEYVDEMFNRCVPF